MKRRIACLFANRVVMNTTMRMLYAFTPIFVSQMLISSGDFFRALMVGSIFSLLTPIVSSVAERKGRRFTLALSLLIFSFGNILIVLSRYISLIAIGMGFCFLGLSVFMATSQAYVADHTPYHKRGQSSALLELSWSCAFFTLVPLIGLILRYINAGENTWKLPFYILALLGVVGFVFLLVLLPHEKSTLDIDRSPGGFNTKSFITALFQTPNVLPALIYGFSIQTAAEYLNLTYALWFHTDWGVQIMALGSVAVIIGISEFCGESSVIFYSDRIGKKNVGLIGNLLGAVSGLMIPFAMQTNYVLSVILVALFFVGFEISISSSMSIMTEILPSCRAAFMGLYVAVMQFGRVVAALVTPYLIMWGGNDGYSWAVRLAGIFFVVAMLAMRSVKVSEGQTTHKDNDNTVVKAA